MTVATYAEKASHLRSACFRVQHRWQEAVDQDKASIGFSLSLMGDVISAMTNAAEAIDELDKTCGEFSAGLCPLDGVVGDEGGTPVCKFGVRKGMPPLSDSERKAILLDWLIHTANADEISAILLSRMQPYQRMELLSKMAGEDAHD